MGVHDGLSGSRDRGDSRERQGRDGGSRHRGSSRSRDNSRIDSEDTGAGSGCEHDGCLSGHSSHRVLVEGC